MFGMLERSSLHRKSQRITLTDSLAKEGLWALFFSQTNNTKENLLLQGDFAKEVM